VKDYDSVTEYMAKEAECSKANALSKESHKINWGPNFKRKENKKTKQIPSTT
jgi:hypothetical protein